MRFIKNLILKIKPKSLREIENEYLSNASDHADLERRMKRIDRGQAPFQINANLKDWV